jgi:hypothetical protein
MRLMTLSLLTLFAVACGGKNPGTTAQNAEFSEAAPDVSALTLDESNTETAGGGATREAAIPEASIAADVKTSVQDLNDGFKKILAQVEAMTAKDPTSTADGTRVWNASKDGISYQLSIHKKATGLFGWKMEAKKDADAAYVTVMIGHIKRTGTGLEPRRGAGVVGLDLSAFKGVADGTSVTFTKSGKVFAAFQHNAAGAHLLYRLKDFQRDTTNDAAAVDAYFSGYRLFKTAKTPAMAFVRAGGHVNLTQFDDLKGPANETVTARLRRIVGLGGWGRAIISGGDLPADTHRVVRECWRAPETGSETIYLRQIWNCTGSFDRAAMTYPTCTLASTYPAQTASDNDPDSAKSRGAFIEVCFADAAAAVRLRLATLASLDPKLPQDPGDADDSDETPVEAFPGDQQDPANVETDDANTVSTATTIDSLG